MTIEEIKKKLETTNEITFILYSLVYIISKKDNLFYITTGIHDSHINAFNTIDDLLDNYLIYGESIRANENRILSYNKE